MYIPPLPPLSFSFSFSLNLSNPVAQHHPSSFSFFFFFLSLSSFRRRFRAFDQQKFLTVDSGTLLKRVADDGVGQEI